jgi:amino acid exporter
LLNFISLRIFANWQYEGRTEEFMQTDLHSVLTVVMLFFCGLVSPGPNVLVVVENTLNFGRSAGLVTGLGAALGDAVYASIGLFGVTQLTRVDTLMTGIELLGGSYLAWLGARMLWHRRIGAQLASSLSLETVSARAHFWRGLWTDLANPKTVVFFASIFAVAVTPATTGTVRGTMLAGIVLTSVLWRFFVSTVFSTTFIRKVYERTERTVERVFGAALCCFGVLLVKQAVS